MDAPQRHPAVQIAVAGERDDDPVLSEGDIRQAIGALFHPMRRPLRSGEAACAEERSGVSSWRHLQRLSVVLPGGCLCHHGTRWQQVSAAASGTRWQAGMGGQNQASRGKKTVLTACVRRETAKGLVKEGATPARRSSAAACSGIATVAVFSTGRESPRRPAD